MTSTLNLFMISYKLIIQNTVDVKHPELPVVVKPGDDNFKAVVLQRNLKINRFKAGDRVKVRKSARRGNVMEVITDVKCVNWDRNKAHFLVVQWEDGSTAMCSPSQLKPSRL